MSRVTLYAMNNNYNILDSYSLPDGMKKDILDNALIYYCGQLAPWIQQPDFLKISINSWFERMKENFNRMFLALNEEYNPLHNYDRYEDWNDVGSTKSSSKADSKSKGDSTSVNNVSAFNSNNYQPSGQNNASNFNSSEAVSNGESSSDNKHSGHLYGNIGVTTSAQMLQGEMDVRTIDLYKTIALMFQHEFLLEVF